MQGSPVRAFFIVLLALLALGFPLWVLTTPADQVAPTQVTEQTSPSHSHLITLQFAHLPESWTLSSGSTVLQSSDHPDQYEYLLPVQLPIPSSGIVRLTLSAQWQGINRRTAVTITLDPEGQPTQAETKWSISGKMHDLFEFRTHPAHEH